MGMLNPDWERDPTTGGPITPAPAPIAPVTAPPAQRRDDDEEQRRADILRALWIGAISPAEATRQLEAYYRGRGETVSAEQITAEIESSTPQPGGPPSGDPISDVPVDATGATGAGAGTFQDFLTGTGVSLPGLPAVSEAMTLPQQLSAFLTQQAPGISPLFRSALQRRMPQLESSFLLNQAQKIGAGGMGQPFSQFLQGPHGQFPGISPTDLRGQIRSLVTGAEPGRGAFGAIQELGAASPMNIFNLAWPAQGISPRHPLGGAFQNVARRGFERFLGGIGEQGDPSTFLQQLAKGGFNFFDF